MKSEELKNELHKYIDNADAESLNILHEVIVNYLKNPQKIKPIVPMTIEEYHEMILEAEKDIENGAIFSEEEVNAYFDKKYGGKL